MRILPAPGPEPPGQIALADRPWQRRVGAALVASGVMLLLLLGIVWLGRMPGLPLPQTLSSGFGRGLVFQIPITLAVVSLTHRLAGFANVGLQLRGAGTSVLLSIPILAVALAERTPGHLPAVGVLVGALVLALLVGLTEELYARGLLVTLLGGRRHALLAIFGSSILFAYLHMPIYVHRHGWYEALLRCTASAAFSLAFAIIRLRSGSIAGPIVFHVLNDAQFLLVEHPAPNGAPASFGIRPMIAGTVAALVYWLACRKAIGAHELSRA